MIMRLKTSPTAGSVAACSWRRAAAARTSAFCPPPLDVQPLPLWFVRRTPPPLLPLTTTLLLQARASKAAQTAWRQVKPAMGAGLPCSDCSAAGGGLGDRSASQGDRGAIKCWVGIKCGFLASFRYPPILPLGRLEQPDGSDG